MKISDPEATQVAIIPDGMSALTFLYLDCLTCLLVPILFQKKRFQMSTLKSGVSLVSLVVLPVKERADKQIQFRK